MLDIPEKNDVFTLGVTMLSASTLVTPDKYYNWIKRSSRVEINKI